MTGFILKLIAAGTMLVDHAGLLLFPDQDWMRVVGRIAYPLYAYCIAEGFRYTRHRLRYFLQIFLLGAACQVVYTVAEGELYLGILLTFSLSILLMGAARELLAAVRHQETALGCRMTRGGLSDKGRTLVAVCGFFLLTVLTVVLTAFVRVDYGFCGVLVPLAAYLPEKVPVRKGAFALMLLVLSLDRWFLGDTTQIWCMAAVILLLLYNGQPGRYRMKWFFYIFYPAHMAVLYLLSVIL